jgi:hypothetical protein
MTTKRGLAAPDLIFAVVACVLAVVLFQSSVFGDVCRGAFRFRSLPAFDFMPVQIWMKLGVLTALVVPGLAAWVFRHRREIVVPALAQALLLPAQIVIEAIFVFAGEIDKIALVGAVFSTWRAVRLVQLGVRTGEASSTWRIVFFACALQWTINLSFLIIVLSRNCAGL